MIKRYLRAELLFQLGLVVFSLFFLITSFDYSYKNKAFPLAFAVAGLLLSLASLGRYLRRAANWTAEEVAAYGFNWRVPALALVLSGFLAVIYVAGTVIGTVLFAFCFIAFWGRQKIWIALAGAGVSFVVIYGIFGFLMDMPLYKGLLDLI